MFKTLSKSVALTMILISLAFCGCGGVPPALEKHTEYKKLYGTTVRLDVCYAPEEEVNLGPAFAEVWEAMDDVQVRMNVFDERSDVAKVNHSYPQEIEVGATMYEVLQESRYFWDKTGHVFDITVYPLIRLWKESAKADRYPSPAQLNQAKAEIGSDQIELLGNNRVRLRKSNIQIDLGGIAAGYAVDGAVNIFRKHGLNNFLIDAGGDMYAAGHNCGRKPWRIGIKDPRDTAKLIDVVELSDMAVSTSGNYAQHITIQGEQWSHIINPVTGYPQRGVVSATVIAPRGIDVDAIATALCVWEPKTGTEFIDAQQDGWASIIFSEENGGGLRKTQSKNYARYKSQRTE